MRAAHQREIRAGDQVSVTLAPRFTVVLQQALSLAAAVVGRSGPTVPDRPGAPDVIAHAGGLAIVLHTWSRRTPSKGGSSDRLIVRMQGRVPVSPKGPATPPRASASAPAGVAPPARVGDPTHPGSAVATNNASARGPGPLQGTGPRGGSVGRTPPRSPAVARARASTIPTGRTSYGVKRVPPDTAMGSGSTPQRRPCRDGPGPWPPRLELTPDGWSRSAPRREPRVAPVANGLPAGASDEASWRRPRAGPAARSRPPGRRPRPARPGAVAAVREAHPDRARTAGEGVSRVARSWRRRP